VGRDAERVGGRRVAFLGDGGGDVAIVVDLFVCCVLCTHKMFGVASATILPQMAIHLRFCS